MNDDFVSSSIIRQRGQLTLPESLRRRLDWLGEDKVVQIVLNADNKVVVTPYLPSQNNKNTDWNGIWKTVNKFQKKRNTISLSDFVIRDRYSH